MNSNSAACAITGATGYVGSVIAEELRRHMPVVALVRKPTSSSDIAWSFESSDHLTDSLRERNVKTLVHVAWDMRASTLADLNRICVNGSAALFESARQAGVERIIFISTISAFTGCRSAYGIAKLSVEKMVEAMSGVTLRPGLVFGPKSGGVFGTIREQVRSKNFIPMIGDGSIPQYLLHETTLANCVLAAVSGAIDHHPGARVTIAHPKPWPFRDLVHSIAKAEGKNPKLVPVPWPLLYSALRFGEIAGLSLPFKSDSVISFIYSQKHPDFSMMKTLGIDPIPYL